MKKAFSVLLTMSVLLVGCTAKEEPVEEPVQEPAEEPAEEPAQEPEAAPENSQDGTNAGKCMYQVTFKDALGDGKTYQYNHELLNEAGKPLQ